ncbi:cupredoxin domain-containing protein [Aestuariimicrobium soli]|uniref:cupredoxin domain-containing protein n=1 Tax=Aestuariimicrobium soli TaxID=2035834 RepID=UPI003EBCF8A0
MLRRLFACLVLALGLTLMGCSQTDAPQAVTIDVTIAGGQVTPNGTTVDVAKGGTVTVNVTSDSADEVHVHGVDKELAVKPGVPATMTFTVDQGGVFEMESHELDKLIVKIAVRS